MVQRTLLLIRDTASWTNFRIIIRELLLLFSLCSSLVQKEISCLQQPMELSVRERELGRQLARISLCFPRVFGSVKRRKWGQKRVKSGTIGHRIIRVPRTIWNGRVPHKYRTLRGGFQEMDGKKQRRVSWLFADGKCHWLLRELLERDRFVTEIV